MSPVNVKVAGAWKSAASVHTKVSGAWKTAADMPVNVGGVWKTGILASGAYESIATVTAAGGESSLTFSSIPSTYQYLQIRGILRKTGTTFGTTALGLRLNSDTGANYARHGLQGNGTSPSVEGVDNQTFISVGYCAVPNNVSSGIYGSTIIDIHDYKSTTKNKTVRAFSGGDTNGAGFVSLASGLWMSTSAIDSITLTLAIDSTTFVAGSTFSLYGIKGA